MNSFERKLKKNIIITDKINILLMDCNGDFYGIVYFCQIVVNINVNVLNDKMNNLDVLFIVCYIIVSIVIGYQRKLNKFASIIDYNKL